MYSRSWHGKRRPNFSGTFRVAVYGTLRRGGRLHPIIERARGKLVGAGTVSGAELYCDSLPIVKLTGDQTAKVVVEVYEINNPMGIDYIEQLECGYDRDAVKVTLQTGDTMDAWMYTQTDARYHGRRVPHGDYIRHYNEQRARDEARWKKVTEQSIRSREREYAD